MEFIESITAKFEELHGEKPQLVVRAPGRINLLGEHTDYNMGFVLPASVNKSIYFAISNRSDENCETYAFDFNEEHLFTIEHLEKSEKGWPNYLMGAVDQITKKGKIKGFNLVFGGDIPSGAGMSSSAALESGLLFALNQLNDLKLSKIEIVKMAQRVENEFVGLNCGIMDMFASVMGRKKSVIQLDCRSLEYYYFPFQAEGISIVLCNSGVKHSLADSAYNKRREECEEGVTILKTAYPEIESLRNVSMEQLLSCEAMMSENVFKRCRYVVSEIDRVMLACEDLEKNDFKAFGKRMYETHEGLKDDYEVSCKELDFLVDFANPNLKGKNEANEFNKGVLGARLMGGGFGGCTINLVKSEFVEDFKAKIAEAYQNEFGIALEIYEVEIVDGVSLA